MSYIGTIPKDTFTTGLVDRFTSTTGTTVTLTHEISSKNDIIVFVNFVKQDSTNYSVGGTGNKTLTLGGTLVSSDIVEVHYLNKVFATQQPSANSVGITELNLSDGTSGQALITNGSGALSFGSISAGVVQSAFTSSNTAHQHGATTYQTAFSSSAFTPTSASNKILVIGHFAGGVSNGSGAHGNSRDIIGRLVRNVPSSDTELIVQNQLFTRETGGYLLPLNFSFAYLDTSYNSTNAITYSFQTKGEGSGWDIYFQQDNGYSMMTILELSV